MKPGKGLKLLLIGIGACAIMLGTGCSAHNYKAPPVSAEHPLLYSNAQQVTVQKSRGPNGMPVQEISFQTVDKPDAVPSFYMNALLGDGWKYERRSKLDKLHFYWIEGCPVHGMDVILAVTSRGQTSVRLVSSQEECI